MAWNQAAVTDKGLELLAEAVEKGGVTITRAAGGETCCAEAELTAQTEVSAPARHIDIARKERSGSVITVNLRISNTGAAQAFTVRQIGLYAAANGSEEEVLLALIQDERGEEIPSEAENPEYLLELDLAIPVSNADKIEVNVTDLVVEGLLVEINHKIDAMSEKLDNISAGGGMTVKILDDYTWQEISDIAASGKAPLYFEVGDCKQIHVKGNIGILEDFDEILCVFILGFNHDVANAIDFGTFKSALYDGYDIALCTSNYNKAAVVGTFDFTMTHCLGGSDYWYNYGGWAYSDLRYDILGSTNVHRTKYGANASSPNLEENVDATPTCATDPVPNTLMAALPEDLRAVMKPMTIWTDNYGNTSNLDTYVTSSIDYLPLMSEDETGVFATSAYRHANTFERQHSTQYTYYKLGNSPEKYYHDRVSNGNSIVQWLFRSPAKNNSSGELQKLMCTFSRNNATAGVQYSMGLAPVFRVGGAAA